MVTLRPKMPAQFVGLRLQCLHRCPQAEQAGDVENHPEKESGTVASITRNQMKMRVGNMLIGSFTVIQEEMRTIDPQPGAARRCAAP
jgi:3-phenylpropionate/cinnamic acid dioxygenase small subunit